MNIFPYDLRKENTLHLPLVHLTRHGINSLLFRSSLLWNNRPREIKERLSSSVFKCSLHVVPMGCMFNIVTQLDKASTKQLQGIYKWSPFRYLLGSLSLLGDFASWYLLVYSTRSKPTINKMLIKKILMIYIHDAFFCFCFLFFVYFISQIKLKLFFLD